MTDWAGFRSTVLSALSTFAGDNVAVSWENDRRDMASTHVLLDIVSSPEMGTRLRLIPQGVSPPKLAWSVIRDITVQIKGESENDPSNLDALGALEPIRLGMLQNSFLAALGSDITLEFDLLPTLTPLRYTSDGRTISVYVFEATFRACFDHQPGSDQGTIEAVNATYDINFPGGSIGEVTSLDNLIYSRLLTQDGALDSGVVDANVNAAAVAAFWELRPPAGQVWYMARLMTHIKCSGAAAWDEFGDISLTNGIAMKTVRGTGASPTVTQHITDDAHKIADNDLLRLYQFDVDIVVNGSGPSKDSVHARMMLSRFTSGREGGIFLDGNLDDAFRITLNDDFSALTTLHFTAQGQIWNTQQVVLP